MEGHQMVVTASFWLNGAKVTLSKIMEKEGEDPAFYLPWDELRNLFVFYDGVEIKKELPE